LLFNGRPDVAGIGVIELIIIGIAGLAFVGILIAILVWILSER
jgi:hypothetical protein